MVKREHATETCPPDDDLIRYHGQEMSAADAATLRDHLARCAECAERSRRVVAAHETLIQRLREVGPPPAIAAAQLGSASLHAEEIPGYEILERIRDGGQGVVFRATQNSTQRVVAIKILREGAYASPAARRRFEREIELAATLRHPGIVTVFDSGRTPGGRDYLVMDFVHGRPLDRYLRAAAPSCEQRLLLFTSICDAVNAAHQRGVIHRDLKPANILVSDAGEPALLDFGLARSIQQPEPAHVTATGEVAGTLPYMSPEQARGQPDAVDVRSDVYALGVILFEMLFDRLPYPLDGDALQALRHIAETPPSVPDHIRDFAASTQTRAGSARQRVPHDLQTIVRKALEKEPQRRYQTAGNLLRDVQRFLAGEPIDAKRDSGLYLLRRALHRYRTAAVLLGVIMLLIVASSITLGLMAVRQARLRAIAEEQTRVAHDAQAAAQRRFDDARELTRFFVLEFDGLIKRLPGSAAARAAIVNKGLEYLRILAEDAGDDPTMQHELATGYIAIGDVQGDMQSSNLGERSDALSSYQHAAAILDALATEAPSADVAHSSVLVKLKIGDVLTIRGAEQESAAAYRDALALAERALIEYPDEPRIVALLSTGHERLGSSFVRRALFDDARREFEETLRIARRIPDGLIDEFVRRHGEVAALTHLGRLDHASGELKEAYEHYAGALEAARAQVALRPEDREACRNVAVAQQWLGIISADAGRHEQALEHYDAALATLNATLALAPDDEPLLLEAATVLSKAGEAHMALERRPEALADYQRSLDICQRACARNPDFAAMQRLRGVAHYKFMEVEREVAENVAHTRQQRLSAAQRAHESLERCLAVFVQMQERGILPAPDAGVPDELRAELATLQALIEELSLEPPPS